MDSKTNLEPRVPLVILRLSSLLTLVIGMLGGIIALGNACSATQTNGSEVSAALALIFGSIVMAALLSVIAAICDNLIEIRKRLSKE